MVGGSRHISRRQVLRTGAAAALLPVLGGGVLAKAPMLGAAMAQFHRFKLGDFEVTMLRDGASMLSGPYPAFGGTLFEEDVNEVVSANFLPTNKFELPYAPLLINTGVQLILFDAGNGGLRKPAGGHMAAAIAAAGYKPEQVDTVVLTHCHPDHVGGLMAGDKPVFVNARYICGDAEYNFWAPKGQAERNDGIGHRARIMQAHVVPLAAKMTFIKPTGDVAPGIRALPSPGHTPGHLAYHVESKGRRLMIWGDAVVHYVMSVQRPEWELAADQDHATAIATRKRLLDMAAAEKLLVTGYHMPFPAIGYIDKMKDGRHRWVPASYQMRL